VAALTCVDPYCVARDWVGLSREHPLRNWDVEALSPDAFVRARSTSTGTSSTPRVTRIADSWRNPPGSAGDVLDHLERDGLAETAAALRD
jgi:hypothetical protein